MSRQERKAGKKVGCLEWMCIECDSDQADPSTPTIIMYRLRGTAVSLPLLRPNVLFGLRRGSVVKNLRGEFACCVYFSDWHP